MPSKKRKGYDPNEWKNVGFCGTCMKPLLARRYGKEAKHEDNTTYCGDMPNMRRCSNPADPWSKEEIPLGMPEKLEIPQDAEGDS